MRLGVPAMFIVLSAAVPAWAQERCEPAACLTAISSKVAVTLADVGPVDVTGVWSRNGVVSGEHLYLFSDHSFVYTEWSEFLPQTIADKGAWQLDAGVIRLFPDADVAWDPGTDRRFAALSVPTAPGSTLLFGLDRSLDGFQQPGHIAPRQRLDAGAFTRTAGIGEQETEALKKRLLHRAGVRPTSGSSTTSPSRGANFESGWTSSTRPIASRRCGCRSTAWD